METERLWLDLPGGKKSFAAGTMEHFVCYGTDVGEIKRVEVRIWDCVLLNLWNCLLSSDASVSTFWIKPFLLRNNELYLCLLVPLSKKIQWYINPHSSLFLHLCRLTSLAITESHQRAAGWWRSCRLACQPKVSSTSFRVSAGWLKTGEMVWLPDCSMWWIPAPSTLFAKWVTKLKTTEDLLCGVKTGYVCICVSTLGCLFSLSCHRWHSVCWNRHPNLYDSVRSQWDHRGDAAAQERGQVSF